MTYPIENCFINEKGEINMLIIIGSIMVFHIHWVMAYLDPGSGSYILQLVIAGFMGALFMLGVYWRKVKAFVKNVFNKEEGAENSE